jgi:hypothetical protein
VAGDQHVPQVPVGLPVELILKAQKGRGLAGIGRCGHRVEGLDDVRAQRAVHHEARILA